MNSDDEKISSIYHEADTPAPSKSLDDAVLVRSVMSLSMAMLPVMLLKSRQHPRGLLPEGGLRPHR